MLRTLLGSALAAAALLPAAAGAQTYDVTSGFASSDFRYGYGVGGQSFTVFTRSDAPCGVNNTQRCYDNGGNLPVVGRNTLNTAYVNGTSTVAAGAVYLHPGAASNLDAILRFVVPTAGIYSLTGAWSRYDTTSFGTGVVAAVWQGAGGVATALSSSVIQPNSYGSSTSFSAATTLLAAGDTIDFVVNWRDAFEYDTTGLSATISLVDGAVPEPATWGMMLIGFGVAGGAMRVRRRRVAFG